MVIHRVIQASYNHVDLIGQNTVNMGAGDGTRTRDSLLGRQELYQLSYSRAGAEGET